MKSVSQPKPKKILNLAASQSGIMAHFWSNPDAPGTSLYNPDPPTISEQAGNVLFVENGVCVMHPLAPKVILSSTFAAAVSGVTTAFFAFDQGFHTDGILLVCGMMLICGVGVGLLILWLAWIFRISSMWPIYLVQEESGIKVQLVHRKPWCMLESLSPTLTYGSFDWRNADGTPIKSKRLSKSLQQTTYACWLQLNYKSRRRWIVLSLHEEAKEASDTIPDWASTLNLTSENSISDDQPPSIVRFYHNPKLL